MKRYRITYHLEPVEVLVTAHNVREAKKKGIVKLDKKKPSKLIHRTWPDKKQEIYIDDL